MKVFMFTIITLLTACYIYADDNTRYVSSPNGLILRSSPAQKSKPIILIPFKTKITIRSKSDNISIDGFAGEWVNTTYLGKEGWLFSGYTSMLKPAELNIENIKFIRTFRDSVSDSGIPFNNKTIQLNQTPSIAIEKYGLPHSQVNNDCFGYLIYKEFSLEFGDFLTDDLNSLTSKNNKSKALILHGLNRKIHLEEIINAIGKPQNIFFETVLDKGKWFCFYELKNYKIHFAFDDLNDSLSYIRVSR